MISLISGLLIVVLIDHLYYTYRRNPYGSWD